MIDTQRRRAIAGLGAACAAAIIPSWARAAAWPGHAVTFIVPFPAGGPVDTTARFTTQPLGQLWSVPTVVDNRSGAGGIVGAQFAAKAEPDGYSFFFASIHHAVLPSLRDNLSYDIRRDFEPVGMAAVFPIVLVVNPSLPVNSVSELIAYAKANPGKLSFGSSGVGAAAHLTSELMKQVTGIDMVHVPYKGTAPALADLASGNIQLLIDAPIGVMTQVRAGKIRALAMLSKNRVPGVEEVPTIVEAGGPLIESSTWVMFLAPAGTPKEIVDKVSSEVSKAVKDEALRKRLAEQAVIPVGATPEETGKFLRSEIDKWEKVITTAGVKPDA